MSRRLALLLILLAVGCGAPPAGPSGAPSPRSRAPVGSGSGAAGPALDPDRLARSIHDATNEARRRQGVGPLAWDARLAPVAAAHSRDMARRGFFDHVSPEGADANDRARRAGVRCEAPLAPGRVRVGVLENLYKTSRWTAWRERTVGGRTTRDYDWQTPEAITRAVVDGWLASPGHRRNLLDPSARGEAVAVGLAADDAVYVTQVLC